MFPLISCLDEVRRIRAILNSVVEELCQQGHDVCGGLPLGIMVEVPSAVLLVDQLAPLVDFFSIGTNDLIQYTLAIDRTDEEVAHLYDPLHPAVLYLLAHVIGKANKAGIPISVCGEMAGNVDYARLLLGLGLRQFSMNSAQLLCVKQCVLSTSLPEIVSLTQRILLANDPLKIREQLEKLNAA